MSMTNPATRPHNELNEFTRAVKQLIEGKKRGDFVFELGEYWVELRNGTLVRPIFKEAEDETCEDAFFTEDRKYCWNLDGTSVTSYVYDMMEIVSK